jgi:hypothetical protein
MRNRNLEPELELELELEPFQSMLAFMTGDLLSGQSADPNRRIPRRRRRFRSGKHGPRLALNDAGA